MNAIKDLMTLSPHAIGHDQPLKLAQERMHQWGIRHLPVLDGGALVGVLSERDIALIGAISPQRVDALAVEEAMSTEPYAVAPETPAREVVQHMADYKYGCAVVMEQHKVVGIFTSTDALSVLATLLREREQVQDVPPAHVQQAYAHGPAGARVAAHREVQDSAVQTTPKTT